MEMHKGLRVLVYDNTGDTGWDMVLHPDMWEQAGYTKPATYPVILCKMKVVEGATYESWFQIFPFIDCLDIQ